MRILFLAHRLPYPPDKGEKMRALGMLQALAKKHEIDLFSFYDDPGDEKHVESLRPYCRDCYAERLSPLRGRVQALAAAARRRSFTLAFFHSDTMARRVSEALRTRSYDVIFIYCSAMMPYVEHDKRPRVMDMVDVDSQKWVQYGEKALPPLSWLWKQEARLLADYENRSVEKIEATIVCTDVEAATLRLHTQKKIHVIPHIMDMSKFDPQAVQVTPEMTRWQPYIAFTGNMDYLPNVDAVTYFHQEIFPKIRAAVPQVRLVIVGRNPAPKVLRLAADPQVRVTGWVDDTRPYLRGAAVAVVPLGMARGLQSKILEAMSMGIPTVATSLPVLALPEELRSWVATEDDPAKFAERVVEILRRWPSPPDEAMRKAMLTHFDRDRLGGQLEAIIAESVARPRVLTSV